MQRSSVIFVLLVIVALSAFIDAQRWRQRFTPRPWRPQPFRPQPWRPRPAVWRPRPAPGGVFWRTRRICTPQCGITRSCTPGGQCVQWGRRTQNICIQHAWNQVCANYQPLVEEVCVSSNAHCQQWDFISQKYCAHYQTIRTPIMGVVNGECTSFQNRCVHWNQENVPKCVRYGNRCAQVTRGSKRLCVQWNQPKPQRQCAEWQTVTDKICTKAKKRCAQYKKYSRRVCLKTAEKCSKWEKKHKLTQKKVCKSKAKVCVNHKTYKYARCRKFVRTGVCARYGQKITRVCALAKRKCLGYQTFSSRVCVQGGRKCNRWFKQRLGDKCVLYKYKRSQTKRCVQFGRKWVSTVPLQCQRYAENKGRFQYFCKKYQTIVKNTRYCAKRVGRYRRICLSWRGTCARYAIRKTKVCNKVGSQCVKYINRKTSYCQAYKRRCAQLVHYIGRKCTKYAEKCISWGVDTCANEHYWKCTQNSKICSKHGFRIHNLCVRYKKVCAQTSNVSRRVCKRFVQTNKPRTCARYVTIPTVGCSRWEKFCAKSIVGVKRQCIRTARFCTGYRKILKPIGWNTRHVCAAWRFKHVRTACKRYGHSCAKKIRRVTGRRCAHWTRVHTCARSSVRVDNYCVRVASPRCFSRRSCTSTCRTIRVQVRADVHLQQLNGKWIDFNYGGLFKYFGHGPCDAQIRLKRVKNGSVTTGVAVKCNNNVFKATPRGISINGKRLKHASAKFGRRGSVAKLPGKLNQYRFVSGHGLNLRIDLERKFGLVSVGFHETNLAKGFKDTGLITPGSEKFARDYVVPKGEALFKRYPKFQKIPARSSVSYAERKSAERKCRRFLEPGHPSFKQCVSDYLATGINYGPTYVAEKKMLTKKTN